MKLDREKEGAQGQILEAKFLKIEGADSDLEKATLQV
jgi:hypothetical protein